VCWCWLRPLVHRILSQSLDQRSEDNPIPAARLLAFGDNGIELELRIWITGPQQGLVSVRSDVYLRIRRLFKAAGIVIPFPQRDLHLLGPWPGKPRDG